ncbi:MAG: hypothetical protein ACLQVD_07550 [Capsulimonadaceae bacterium]
MSLYLDVSPQVEAKIYDYARQRGIEPTAFIEDLVEQLPDTSTESRPVSDRVAATVAMLDGFLAESPTDPEELRQAEAEFEEFIRNLNANRVMAGERPLLPS